MPTREILIDLSNDSFEGLIDGNGRMLARPTAARIAGESVILPVTLSAKIVDGEFVGTVALEVTDPEPLTWAWIIELKDALDTTQAERVVAVPLGDGSPIAVGDLPVVDVCTLQPDAEPTASWWLAVQPFIDAWNAGELQGDPGAPGQSAYQIAVANGFVGTEAEWLASLDGEDGTDGLTPELRATATDIEWRYVGAPAWNVLIALSELKGDPGDPGAPGASAYQVAVANGFVGTEAEWLDSLVGPTGVGVKTYASAAEADAVATTEQGYLRLANQAALQAFFGPGGTDMFFGADILIQSFLSDNYGTGFAPAANGQLQQVAWVTDGYNDNKKLTRYRGYNSGTSTWGPWGGWEVVPVPGFRPAAKALWLAAPAINGSDDDWLPTLNTTDVPTAEAASGGFVAQHWDAMFASADRYGMVGGQLQIKSASFEFQGILDAARADVGTVSFVARNTADVARQTAHVDAVAAAAGANAVAGFSMPLDIATRPGLLFHATFAMKSGMTANTKLLCGLVATADIATAMADNDPTAVNNFIGAGYGSTDAFISAYQRATGAISTVASTAAPSTTANQIIDFKMWIGPNNNAVYHILTVRSTGTVVKVQGTPLGNGISNSAALSFFIRASAGGTSATPRLALHRLRIGSGFGAVGGS